jgi:hypothetical protein
MIDKIALPTVGRIVLYHDPEHVDPFGGFVTAVNANRYTIPVLSVFLHDGVRVMTEVKHKDCVKLARGEPYWDWMDYQKGQAAKTEALQAELDGKLKQSEPYNQSVDERYKNQSSTPSPVDGKR